MFIEIIVLSIVIGLVRGGKFSRFAKVNFKKMWLLIVALVIQYFLVTASLIEEIHYIDKMFDYTKQLLFLSYIILFAGTILNLRYRSLWFVLAGSVLNFIVTIANGWKRPILLEGLKLTGFEKIYQLLEEGKLSIYSPIVESTKLSFLGDIIIVPKPYPYPHIFSIGDLIISLGLFTLIQEIMLSNKRTSGGMMEFNYIGRM